MKIIILYYWQIGRNEKNSNRFNLVPNSILSEYLLEYCCCIWMYVSIKWVDPCGDGITKIWLNWFGDFTKVSVWYTSRFFFKNEDVFPSVNYHLLSVRIMTSFLQIYYMASKEMLSTRANALIRRTEESRRWPRWSCSRYWYLSFLRKFRASCEKISIVNTLELKI